jgi:hypothetical protein
MRKKGFALKTTARMARAASDGKEMVGDNGFEPLTSSM